LEYTASGRKLSNLCFRVSFKRVGRKKCVREAVERGE
jgi:hypothetical protein